MMPTLEHLRRAIAGFDPPPEAPGAPRTAAVAVVLREGGAGAEALFIRRAEHPHDPWSGHMAFPGGRVDPGDADALAAARRETREELDLDLDRHARLIGRLSTVRTHLTGRAGPHHVVPFAFELAGDPPLVPNYEVQEALWIPLAFFGERGNRTSLLWRVAGLSRPFPCYRFDGRVVWGLTLRILDELLALAG